MDDEENENTSSLTDQYGSSSTSTSSHLSQHHHHRPSSVRLEHLQSHFRKLAHLTTDWSHFLTGVGFDKRVSPNLRWAALINILILIAAGVVGLYTPYFFVPNQSAFWFALSLNGMVSAIVIHAASVYALDATLAFVSGLFSVLALLFDIGCLFGIFEAMNKCGDFAKNSIIFASTRSEGTFSTGVSAQIPGACISQSQSTNKGVMVTLIIIYALNGFIATYVCFVTVKIVRIKTTLVTHLLQVVLETQQKVANLEPIVLQNFNRITAATTNTIGSDQENGTTSMNEDIDDQPPSQKSHHSSHHQHPHRNNNNNKRTNKTQIGPISQS